MEIKDLKNILSNSYKDKEKQDESLNGLVRDNHLSGKRVQVYHNPLTNEAIVSHRGTTGIQDWMTDGAMSVGLLKNTERYKHAKKIQKEAEKKYNVTDTVGHSLGGSLAETVAKKSDKVTTLNKPVGLHNITDKVKKKQTDYKTSLDPVSMLRPLQRGKKATVFKSKTYNPFKEHSINF